MGSFGRTLSSSVNAAEGDDPPTPPNMGERSSSGGRRVFFSSFIFDLSAVSPLSKVSITPSFENYSLWRRFGAAAAPLSED